MVKIRLTRVGRKNAPAYRIVAIDQKSRRDGRAIEVIGHYNPAENPDNVVIKKDRFDHWVSVGAQPSDAVNKLVNGTYVYKPYNPNAKEEEVAEVVETAETEAPAEAENDTQEASEEAASE